jgi:hypothetical protein
MTVRAAGAQSDVTKAGTASNEVTKSYRAELTVDGRPWRTASYETRELAAAELARLLRSPVWQERLIYMAPKSKCSVRLVEVEAPTEEVHALAAVSLDSFSEAVRRQLYDQAVADHFEGEFFGDDGVESFRLPYSPDEANLTVFYLHGRWFVTFNRLERTTGTEEDRSEVLRIYSTERGISYQEV